MIKVLEEKDVPRAEINCSNCGSKLEYGNADLFPEIDNYNTWMASMHRYYFNCPVCGCKQYANWIDK